MPELAENTIEKGFADQSLKTPGERVAHFVSLITSPLFLALPFFLLVSLRTAPTLFSALEWWIIIIGGFTVAPFLFVRQGVKRGTYTDGHVSVRSQRLIPLLFGLACMIVVFLLLLVLKAALPLLVSIIAALTTLAIATAVTQVAKYKISLHMVGVTGAVTVCWLLFGPIYLLLTPLIVLVGWTRWKVGAHTLLQACAGTILAASVTLVCLWAFGLL